MTAVGRSQKNKAGFGTHTEIHFCQNPPLPHAKETLDPVQATRPTAPTPY